MIKLGLLPPAASGGMREPRLLEGPDPGTRDAFLESPVGVFSRMTSIFGASGALIEGTLVWNHKRNYNYMGAYFLFNYFGSRYNRFSDTGIDPNRRQRLGIRYIHVKNTVRRGYAPRGVYTTFTGPDFKLVHLKTRKFAYEKLKNGEINKLGGPPQPTMNLNGLSSPLAIWRASAAH